LLQKTTGSEPWYGGDKGKTDAVRTATGEARAEKLKDVDEIELKL